jgi:hypothetical protein
VQILPDAEDSAHIPDKFLSLSLFLWTVIQDRLNDFAVPAPTQVAQTAVSWSMRKNMIFPTEISETTNKVNLLLTQNVTAINHIDKLKATTEALHISCDLLSKLASDNIFFEYDRVVNEGNKEPLKINRTLTGGAIQLVSMDFGHFEGFLQKEVELLKVVRFDDGLITSVVQQIHHRIEHIRQYPATGAELRRVVIRLQRHVCQQSSKIKQQLQLEKRKKILLLSLIGIGSISANILAVNFLSPVGIGASAGIGGALVTDLVKKLIDEV